METTAATRPSELVTRASGLIDVLCENAAWSEEHRRMPNESLAAISDAGLLRMRVPSRFGGYELGLRDVCDVITEVGRGDGSAAWSLSVWSICAFLVGLFPDEVQEEVFATPDVRICGLLAPGGMATPANGGVMVSGRWPFNTGVLDSHWNSLVAVSPTPDGQMQPILALVPSSDLQIIDDWHTSGLRGTGSVTTVANELFVPQHRVLPMGPILHEQYASVTNADNPIYRTPMLLTACTSTAGTTLGLAKAARDLFFERLPSRKITYTSYEHQADAPITHLRVAEATMRIDEASFHAYRAADLLDSRGVSGEPFSMQERAQVRGDIGRAAQLATEAIELFRWQSGASSAYTKVPMQRIERDIQTLNLHAILHPDTSLELYGRVMCGLEPNSLYI